MLKFKLGQMPEINLLNAKKKPIVIQCAQIQEEFEVESMEGTVIGKKGDWLMIGVEGEKYICDDSIFKKTYELVNKEDS